MKIVDYYPRSSFSFFRLNDLRIATKLFSRLIFDENFESVKGIAKWEQTLSLSKFNRIIVLKEFDNSNEVNLINLKHIDEVRLRKNIVNVFLLNNQIDVSNLKDSSFSIPIEIFLRQKKRNSQDDNLNLSVALVVGLRQTMEKLAREITRANPYESWVGLDPNILLKTGLNEYIPLDLESNKAPKLKAIILNF